MNTSATEWTSLTKLPSLKVNTQPSPHASRDQPPQVMTDFQEISAMKISDVRTEMESKSNAWTMSAQDRRKKEKMITYAREILNVHKECTARLIHVYRLRKQMKVALQIKSVPSVLIAYKSEICLLYTSPSPRD